MNTTKTVIGIMLFGLLAASPAMAVKPGFYLGGSVGGATSESDLSGTTYDDSDVAWKLFAGYHFLQFFAVEGGYRDLGSPSGNVLGDDFKLETTGFDIAGLAGVPLGPVYLFAKVGALWWDSDLTVSGTKYPDDGTGYEAGIGLSIDFWKIQLRGEVEYLDAAEGVAMYTLGAAWRF
jgi:hypothetical protein